MTNTDIDEHKDNILLDILRDAFPGRADHQIIPVGLIYAGVRWGKDYRCCAVPQGARSEKIKQWFAENDDRYWRLSATIRMSKPYPSHPGGPAHEDPYFAWLAKHLSSLNANPNEEQAGLCKYVSQMRPEDAALLIGMNAGLYQNETEPTESWIADNAPFSAWLDNYVQYVADKDEEIDEDALREDYTRVAAEMQEHERLCPTVRLADVPWRVPLSIAVQQAATPNQQAEVIAAFYEAYNKYVMCEKNYKSRTTRFLDIVGEARKEK